MARRFSMSGALAFRRAATRSRMRSRGILSPKGTVMNFARRFLCLLVAIACLLAGAMAQVQTSELHVIGERRQGAVVSDATVTAAEPGKVCREPPPPTARRLSILLSLPPGLYSVTVEAPGFAKLVNSACASPSARSPNWQSSCRWRRRTRPSPSPPKRRWLRRSKRLWNHHRPDAHRESADQRPQLRQFRV